jgi:nitrogen fixation/metabolism regulation signal transduction histidine kinase
VQNISYAIPVGVIGIDPDGIIVQLDKEAEKMLLNNKPDFIGKHYEESSPWKSANLSTPSLAEGQFPKSLS